MMLRVFSIDRSVLDDKRITITVIITMMIVDMFLIINKKIYFFLNVKFYEHAKMNVVM